MQTKDIFNVSDEQADEIDQLRDTFEDNADFRAALESYFHIYDDFAEMSEDEFNNAFEEYTKGSEVMSNMNKRVKSSVIGDIKDQFALGQIKEEEAISRLAKQGKGKREAKKILEKWKESGVLKSSVDSVVKEIEDYFGTEAGEDNVIECDDIITRKDVTDIESLLEDNDDVKVKIGMYSVSVDEAPEITNGLNLSVEENDEDVDVDISEKKNSSETSFVQINSEEDFDEYNVHLPEGYEFEDIQKKWWEIDGDDGISMKEVIQRSGDDENFIVIDNDRVFFDTAHNYILDSDLEAEDFGLSDEDFEDGEYIGD